MDSVGLRFELKELDEQGVFRGHAAVFGNVDLGGDVIEPGSFAKTLKDRGGKVVLLDGHDRSARIGVAYLAEDAKGLRVERGVLNLAKPAGQAAYADLRFGLKHGVPMELSIGYETVKYDIRDNVRHLKEVRLWEVSLVTFGMNPKAKVTAVKDADAEFLALKARIDHLEALLSERATSAAPPAGDDRSSDAAAHKTAPPVEDHGTVDIGAQLTLLLAHQQHQLTRRTR